MVERIGFAVEGDQLVDDQYGVRVLGRVAGRDAGLGINELQPRAFEADRLLVDVLPADPDLDEDLPQSITFVLRQ